MIFHPPNPQEIFSNGDIPRRPLTKGISFASIKASKEIRVIVNHGSCYSTEIRNQKIRSVR